MRDRDIRAALHAGLRRVHEDEPDTLIVDELGLCRGEARIDVAVVNGFLNGFEIKSAQDTLERLPDQERVYSRVFDRVTVVASEAHLARLDGMVPSWWGISAAVPVHESAAIHVVRESSENPSVDALSLAQLLWREEALAILSDRGLASGLKSKPRECLWLALADQLDLDELSQAVRTTLKTRRGWRSA